MRTANPVCRAAWRPSRWESGGLLLLGASGIVGLSSCGLPSRWATVLAILCGAWAVVLAYRLQRRDVRRLIVADVATLDGVPFATCRLAWRGPLAFLHARDASGGRQRLAWWPDTLTRRQRRALRLAVDALAYEQARR